MWRWGCWEFLNRPRTVHLFNFHKVHPGLRITHVWLKFTALGGIVLVIDRALQRNTSGLFVSLLILRQKILDLPMAGILDSCYEGGDLVFSILSNQRVALAILAGFILSGQVQAKPVNKNLNLMSVNNKAEMTRAICMNSGATSKLLIAKMAVVRRMSSVKCHSGEAMIRYREDSSDPGHVLVNIDPPIGNGKGLDCDGKADIGLHYIGLNCLQSNLESTSHSK